MVKSKGAQMQEQIYSAGYSIWRRLNDRNKKVREVNLKHK